MKISTFITILLVVGILIFVIVSMVNESEENYDITINKTGWENQYDFASEVNNSVSPIKQSIDDITSEEKGWLEKIGSGFTGIIAAVTFLPTMVWQIGTMGTQLITGIGGYMGIPSTIIFVLVVMLLVWGIIELIQFFQRWNV